MTFMIHVDPVSRSLRNSKNLNEFNSSSLVAGRGKVVIRQAVVFRRRTEAEVTHRTEWNDVNRKPSTADRSSIHGRPEVDISERKTVFHPLPSTQAQVPTSTKATTRGGGTKTMPWGGAWYFSALHLSCESKASRSLRQ